MKRRRKPREQHLEDLKLEKVRRRRPKRPAKKGMGKGALIKGMTRRLPHEILGNPLFREGSSGVCEGMQASTLSTKALSSTTSVLRETSSGASDGISRTATPRRL